MVKCPQRQEPLLMVTVPIRPQSLSGAADTTDSLSGERRNTENTRRQIDTLVSY